MLVVKKNVHPEEWEKFVRSQPYTFFVQSCAYASFYQSLGERSWFFGVYDGDALVGGSLVVSTHARRGNFLYLPYGPIFSTAIKDLRQILALFTRELAQHAKSEGYTFLRVSPFLEAGGDSTQAFRSAGYVPSPLHTLAEHTWLLDVTPSETELLAAMNKNHRNLIRRCDREGVRVEMHSDVAALEPLHTLLDETVRRHRFTRFSREYIEEEFAAMAIPDRAVFQAYLPDGRLDASAVIFFYGSMAVYRHSGSRGLDHRLPTSYLLQWEAIREARRRNMVWYNFWGIAPEGAGKKHPFFGITHFKKGFGGKGIHLMHCQDYPLSHRYWLTYAFEYLRKMRRGF